MSVQANALLRCAPMLTTSDLRKYFRWEIGAPVTGNALPDFGCTDPLILYYFGASDASMGTIFGGVPTAAVQRYINFLSSLPSEEELLIMKDNAQRDERRD